MAKSYVTPKGIASNVCLDPQTDSGCYTLDLRIHAGADGLEELLDDLDRAPETIKDEESSLLSFSLQGNIADCSVPLYEKVLDDSSGETEHVILRFRQEVRIEDNKVEIAVVDKDKERICATVVKDGAVVRAGFVVSTEVRAGKIQLGLKLRAVQFWGEGEKETIPELVGAYLPPNKIELLAEKLGTILLGAKLGFNVLSVDERGGKSILIPAERKITKVMLKKWAENYNRYELPEGATKDLVDGLVANFLLLEHEEPDQPLLLRLPAIQRSSKLQLASPCIHATVREVEGAWENYESLMVDHGWQSLIHWIEKQDDGRTKPYNLENLYMRPAILVDTNQMVFVRLSKKRITYMRTGLQWTGKTFDVYGMQLNVGIEFPQTEVNRRNIIVTLQSEGRGACDIDFLFLGDSVELVGRRYKRGFADPRIHSAFKESLDASFVQSEEHINQLFREFFTYFRYETLGVHNKNIRDFLEQDDYVISLIEFQDAPFIVIQKY